MFFHCRRAGCPLPAQARRCSPATLVGDGSSWHAPVPLPCVRLLVPLQNNGPGARPPLPPPPATCRKMQVFYISVIVLLTLFNASMQLLVAETMISGRRLAPAARPPAAGNLRFSTPQVLMQTLPDLSKCLLIHSQPPGSALLRTAESGRRLRRGHAAPYGHRSRSHARRGAPRAKPQRVKQAPRSGPASSHSGERRLGL